MLAQGDDIVAIPGSKRRSYLEVNAAASNIALSPDELRAIDAVSPAGFAAGTRYPEAAMAAVHR